MNTSYIIINVLLIVLILVGGGYLARSRFRVMPKKDEKETWKKNAQNYNKQLDEYFTKKKDDEYKNLLHPKVSRYQPRLPHRIEGAGEVTKWVKMEMEAPAAGATSMVQGSGELYDMTFVVTFNYMTQTKTGDKFIEGVGKVTRVWAHGKDGWRLVHEHISTG